MIHTILSADDLLCLRQTAPSDQASKMLCSESRTHCIKTPDIHMDIAMGELRENFPQTKPPTKTSLTPMEAWVLRLIPASTSCLDAGESSRTGKTWSLGPASQNPMGILGGL